MLNPSSSAEGRKRQAPVDYRCAGMGQVMETRGRANSGVTSPKDSRGWGNGPQRAQDISATQPPGWRHGRFPILKRS